jgi:hypothetical protein
MSALGVDMCSSQFVLKVSFREVILLGSAKGYPPSAVLFGIVRHVEYWMMVVWKWRQTYEFSDRDLSSFFLVLFLKS